MSNTKWINHRDREILFVDYRGKHSPEELLQILEEEIAIAAASPSRILVLSNFEGTFLTIDFMKRAKEAGLSIGKHKTKHALLGITGLKKILLDGYLGFTGDQHIQNFDTEAEALDWLVGSALRK